MIRSFSLIMAGVMLRVWVPIYYALAAAGIVDFSFETAYAAIAWLCWVRTCCSPSGSPATQPKSRMQVSRLVGPVSFVVVSAEIVRRPWPAAGRRLSRF